MLSQLIQRQVPIGSRVSFVLKSGSEISGILLELGRDHVTLECDGCSATILVEMIGAWRVQEDLDGQSEDFVSSSDNEAISVPSIQQPSSIESEPPITPPELSTPEVLKKLFEIEARFQARSQAIQIQPVKPDLVFPADELKGKHGADASGIWNRVRDKYTYAEKINELSAKFGRIQPLMHEFKILSERFPMSTALKRHLAYFHWLLGNQREAFDLYRSTALNSKHMRDWYSVAALALKDGKEELACYSLGQFFMQGSITENIELWYLYVRLIQKHSAYRNLIVIVEDKEREFSKEDQSFLIETGLYLLIKTNLEQIAREFVIKWQEEYPLLDLALEAYSHLKEQPSEFYQAVAYEIEREINKKFLGKEISHQPQGYINTYKTGYNYGFLQGIDGTEYFFHRSAISDEDLFEKVQYMKPGSRIPVIFDKAQGPKGPLAIGIALYRSVDEMFTRATEYANDGEYPKAIAQIKKVLELNTDYPSAQEYYEKWREYARVSGVPKGSNFYAHAKRVQLIEKDLEKAAKLYLSAIDRGDNIESAVKDLAALLVQQGKLQEAIQILEKKRKKIHDQQSVDNMLIGFYQNAGKYDQAIELLEKKIKQATTEGKKAQILWQIANGYLRKEDYSKAEQRFRMVFKLQPYNKAAQRNIAICLFKQGQYVEAQQILNDILSMAPDTQAADLLEAIKQAKTTGQFASLDAIVRETILTELITEHSKFTAFFLSRCDYRGISPERIKTSESGEQIYVGTRRDTRHDIERLEDVARQLGTRRPFERAEYYLTAARISESDDPNQFYQYLCRSFSSRGDSFVTENRPLDAARDLYCEALSVYDGYRNPGKGDDKYDEQDAVNALVRFLYSWLGREDIPTLPPKRNEQESVLKQQLSNIDNAIEDVLSKHTQREKVFDAIAYLIFRSKYAGERVLKSLYSRSSLQALSLEYLKNRDVQVLGSPKQIEDFIALWNDLQRKRLENSSSISNELRLLNNTDLYMASLGGNIENIKRLMNRLFFDIDQQRIIQIQRILETALELCKQNTFEEQERLCIQIDNRCRDLLREIEASPTKLSVEEMYLVVETLQKKAKNRLEDIYASSTPQLSLRLPVESRTLGSDRKIEVQIVVSNRAGCSPAEALELVVQEYENTFSVKMDGSLRGGEQQILKIPLQVSDEALISRAFSLPIYAKYRMRTGDFEQTPVNNFSIRLDSEQEFQEIENPYAAFAEGGVVGDPAMFYGREDLIANVAKAIQDSRAQSKCVVIYGQKRAGKSSILYHLKTKLQSNSDLLVLDLGNIGSLLDEHSSVPFLYQILWGILKKLEYAIEDNVSNGYTTLDLSFPTDDQFYNHHSPLVCFKDIFERFRRVISKSSDWHNVRSILLVDEFSYIHGYIANALIPETFMKNWKALLQENYFNAVLVGQDVMPKFKQRFSNEFGTTQDERVTYLRHEDAVRLIDEPILIGGRQGDSRYRERAIERIIDLTAGSPFYIQILCSRLVEYMNRKRASLVTEADVEQVKDEMIQGVTALEIDKFDNLINSGDTSADAIGDEDALKVLTAIAANSQTGPCSRNNIACETQISVDDILEDLVKRDVVERKRGQYYSIRVGLFKEWLIAHQ